MDRYAGLLWPVVVLAFIGWCGAIKHFFGEQALSGFIGICIALAAIAAVVSITSDAIRDFREDRDRRTGCRGSAPTASLSQELSDELLLDQLVAECEQRLNLIPADPLFASRLDAPASIGRAGQGSAP